MGTIAEKMNYLNTTKTNIKNAIIEKGVSVSDNDTFRSYASKIADIEPTLGTKTITANGTYNASDDNLQGYSSVTVDIDDTDLYRDTTDSTYESVKTLSNCGAFPMLSLTAEINAVQDLHGYDRPWAGGAGKNKCPINSGTITVGDFVTFDTPLSSGTYSFSLKASRTPDSGSWASLVLFDKDNVQYQDMLGISSNDLNGSNVVTFTKELSNGLSKIYVYSIAGNWSDSRNYTLSISELQIESGSTATPYEPYANICPITGWDSIDVCQSGVNTSNPTTYTTALSTTCYGGSKDIKGNERFTHGHIASYNGETLPSTWISDRDKYAEGTTPTIGAEVVYELATPTTATSDAIDLTLAEGVNNLWANSGDVGDARYFRKVEL